MLGDAEKDAQAGEAAGVTGRKIAPLSILAEVQALLAHKG